MSRKIIHLTERFTTHTSQWYGCSPLWMHSCTLKIPLWLNDLLHTSQWYRHFPLWMCWCVFRLHLNLNDLLHTSQWYDALHYGFAAISSDQTYKWMTYYTHHSGTDTLHCECAEAASDDAFYGMTYYINHSETDDHHYLCLDVPKKRTCKD